MPTGKFNVESRGIVRVVADVLATSMIVSRSVSALRVYEALLPEIVVIEGTPATV